MFVSQYTPVKPVTHAHLKWFTWSMQLPPFMQVF
jgi:hypothetical protein